MAKETEGTETGISLENSKSWLPLTLGGLVVVLLLFNISLQFNISGQLQEQGLALAETKGLLSQAGALSLKENGGNNSSEGNGKISFSDVIPKGVPDVYGAELGVSFDDVSPYDPQKADAAIKVLGDIDRSTELEGDDLQRYINIASQISCEYCCGAKSIIFDNGSKACGCAHSYAMRGLAKYLIQNHPDEFTDDQILEEMGKWKTLFFPGQLSAKAKILEEKGIELNYVNLAANEYRGIEQGTSGGMVGGC